MAKPAQPCPQPPIPVQAPSPNHGPRRGGATPRLVVLHYTAMPSAAAALQRLCDPAAEVSAHYLIGRDGRLWQMVDEAARAWHAGAGAWGGVTDVNSASIGIEIDNDGASPFAARAMATLEALLPGILGRWRIPPQGVIGHECAAPGRKADPGCRFDWRRLALQGLAIWPGTAAPIPVDAAAFSKALTAIGYPPVAPDLRLAAFRARFRPAASGPLAPTDMAAALDLAARYRVDRATPST